MTSIFERRGGNPARILYRLWDDLTSLNGGNSAAYGSASGRQAVYRWNGDDKIMGYANLTLQKDGRFKLGSMHGSTQRRRISEGTFLGFRWWRGSYNWFVDYQSPAYWQSLWSVENWRQPMPYASERAIGNQYSYANPNQWLELVPHIPTHGEPPWKIVPARNQTDYGKRKRLTSEQAEQWAKFEALRERRYRLQERAETGLLPTPTMSVRTPSVTDNGTKYEGDDAVLKIQALLRVDQPAKLTPRLKEAHA